jgi:choice-of-anchor B domain-containing protein
MRKFERTGVVAMAAWIALALAALAPAHEKLPGGGAGGGGSSVALSDVPCVAGFADLYPCMNVDLLSFTPIADLGLGQANDIWGWTDPGTGTEYAILGMDSGVAFIDLSDPTQPVHVATLPSQTAASFWNDMKVIGDHALVVSEAAAHGMQVLDLTQLAGILTPPAILTATAHYPAFGNAHNLAVVEETAMAYAVGSDSCLGGLHMVDMAIPANPVFAGCFSDDGYTHDAHCVIYAGPDATYQGREICFAANEDSLTIVDVTNKAAPVQVSRTVYAGVGYAHQGWLTPDHETFLADDEFDELDFGTPTRTFVWDVSDLDAPLVSGFHEHATAAIDHNQFVQGGHVFQGNYRAGVRILRLGDPALAEMAEIAFFDTYPSDDDVGFNGVWGVYPFFRSGIVVASDIGGGLFVLQPHLAAISECSDGIDDDADGLVDYPADPGCFDSDSLREDPGCSDGLDNDGDGAIDWDGAGVGPADPTCEGLPYRYRESACGLGFELALCVPLLAALRRRRRAAEPGGP